MKSSLRTQGIVEQCREWAPYLKNKNKDSHATFLVLQTSKINIFNDFQANDAASNYP